MKDTGIILPESEWVVEGYKEPLKPVEGGYGYYGVLTKSKDGRYIQSHITGKFYKRINSNHTIKAGLANAKEYKDKFQLSQTTGLTGNEFKNMMRKRAIRYFVEIPVEKQYEYKSKAWKSRKKFRGRRSLEQQNRKGTCPDQMLDKIKKLKEKLGYVPTNREFETLVGGVKTITNHFGTWNNALKLLGYPSNLEHGYSKEELIKRLQIFYEVHKRSPVTSDFTGGMLPDKKTYYKYWRSLNAARLQAAIPLVMHGSGLVHFSFKQ